MKMHEYSAEIQFATSSHSQASNKFFSLHIFYCKFWLLTCINWRHLVSKWIFSSGKYSSSFWWMVFTQPIGMLCIDWSMNWHFSTEIESFSHEKSHFDCPPFESRTRQEIQNFFDLFEKWKRLINSSDTRLCYTMAHTLKVVYTFQRNSVRQRLSILKMFSMTNFRQFDPFFSRLSSGNWIVKVLADCFTTDTNGIFNALFERKKKSWIICWAIMLG